MLCFILQYHFDQSCFDFYMYLLYSLQYHFITLFTIQGEREGNHHKTHISELDGMMHTAPDV